MKESFHKICRQIPTVCILVETPVELNIQRKVLKLNRIAFDTTDASEAFYLKLVEEVKDYNLPHLKIDIMKFPQRSVEEDLRAKVRDDLPIDNKLQSTFEDMFSEANALAHTVKPDIMYAIKYLSTEKDKVTMLDMTQPAKINKEIKQDSNKIVLTNLGGLEDGILIALVDAFHKTSGNLLDADGQVIMLINVVFTIHRESKKIERVEHNSAATKITAL